MNQNKHRLPCSALLAAGASALLAACAGTSSSGPGAVTHLEARSGSQVAGTVSFSPHGDKILVEARIGGLTPGEHGIHVHEAGDCSAADASSAKGHFNPAGRLHGHHEKGEHHAGDLPNLVADANGRASYRAEISGVQLAAGPQGIIGRSLVVHADPDDYQTQPAGNSGKRVACGVIAAR